MEVIVKETLLDVKNESDEEEYVGRPIEINIKARYQWADMEDDDIISNCIEKN